MNFALLLAALATCAAPTLQVRATTEPARVEVVATIPAEIGNLYGIAHRVLSFGLVDETTGESGPTLFGEYRTRGETLIFTPRHRLTAGYRYRARLELPDYDFLVSYQVPAEKPGEPAVVEAVYPSAAQLPANLLKFYIHFSRPMREGPAIFERIHLLDSEQKPIAEPWRLTELWSDDARRLTLYIHPGRIKTGVNLREELGTVLKPGRKYTLVVTRDVPRRERAATGSAFSKEFTTTAEEHERIDMADWKIKSPPLGSREPLVVEFPKPLDRHLLARCLQVGDLDIERVAAYAEQFQRGNRVDGLRSAPVEGSVEITGEERCWKFTPDSRWTSDEYELYVNPVLEDLAGNTPVRVFDTDLREPPRTTHSLSKRFRTIP